MVPIEIYNCSWLKLLNRLYGQNIVGMTIFPFIFYKMPGDEVTGRLRRHEEYHWYHQLRWLVIPWYIVYWGMLIIYGYENHPWEKLARGAE